MKMKPISLAGPTVVMATGQDWQGDISESRKRSEGKLHVLQTALVDAHWLRFSHFFSVVAPI